jgi:NAD+ synthase
MDWIREELALDPERSCQEIGELLRSTLQRLERSGAIVGLSGGLDSAVVAYLCVRAFGPDRVTLLNLPERDSKAIHQQHARRIADDLRVELQTLDITPVLEAADAYDLLPIRHLPGQRLRGLAVRVGEMIERRDRENGFLAQRLRPSPNTMVARGNAYASIKHRMRMVLLYHHAEIANLLVVGAANRTEWLTGTFSQWGCDQCADIMPILHLYRSQLPPLAEYLGVPEPVRTKRADPDIIPGLHDKEALLGSFDQADQILWGLENGVDLEALSKGFGPEAVERIASLLELSRHMRESPYTVTADEAMD